MFLGNVFEISIGLLFFITSSETRAFTEIEKEVKVISNKPWIVYEY